MLEISSLGLAAGVAPETLLGRLVITPLLGGGGSAFCCGTPTMLIEQKRSCKLSSKMDNMKALFLVTRRKAAGSFLLAPVSSSVNCEYRKQQQQNKRRRLPQRMEAPPSTSFEVYGDVVHDEVVRNAAIVKSRPLTNWNKPKGRSRVFAAWKQLQSWSSHNLLSNTHLEHVHKSSQGPLCNEAAVQPGPPKIRALNHNMQVSDREPSEFYKETIFIISAILWEHIPCSSLKGAWTHRFRSQHVLQFEISRSSFVPTIIWISKWVVGITVSSHSNNLCELCTISKFGDISKEELELGCHPSSISGNYFAWSLCAKPVQRHRYHDCSCTTNKLLSFPWRLGSLQGKLPCCTEVFCGD